MKFIVSLLLIAILSFAACLHFPWWSVAVAAFLVTACIHQPPLYAFLTGFLSVFLLWFVLAFVISYKNDNLLASKVAQLMLQVDNSLLLVLVTGLIGGITAGLASLAASFIRKPRQIQAVE